MLTKRPSVATLRRRHRLALATAQIKRDQLLYRLAQMVPDTDEHWRTSLELLLERAEQEIAGHQQWLDENPE